MVKRIGGYVFGNVLGRGSFGTVYSCTSTATNEVVAIKQIEKEVILKKNLVEQLKREIVILKALNHSNVVKLKDVFQTDSSFYLVLEFMNGGELGDQFSRAAPFSEADARKYFQQLIVGLHHCHANGVAHRDLKVENLLLDGAGVLKINDFGLSNFQVEGLTLKTRCGTRYYVAPEVLQGSAYNGKVADVWSCGVILFLMVSGRFPFDDGIEQRLYKKICNGSYRMSSKFSDQLKDLIDGLLTVDPSNRITIPEIAVHPWFSIGFDPNLLQTAAVIVTDEELTTAIRSLLKQESTLTATAIGQGNSQTAPPASLPVNPALEQHITGKGPADAFDLISRLTAGRLNPLVAGTGSGIVTIIKTVYQFLFKGAPSDVVTGLQEKLKCNPQVSTGSPATPDGLTLLECSLTLPDGDTSFTVTILDTVKDGLRLVELRRQSGSAIYFPKVFQQLIVELGDAVACTSVAATTPGRPNVMLSPDPEPEEDPQANAAPARGCPLPLDQSPSRNNPQSSSPAPAPAATNLTKVNQPQKNTLEPLNVSAKTGHHPTAAPSAPAPAATKTHKLQASHKKTLEPLDQAPRPALPATTPTRPQQPHKNILEPIAKSPPPAPSGKSPPPARTGNPVPAPTTPLQRVQEQLRPVPGAKPSPGKGDRTAPSKK